MISGMGFIKQSLGLHLFFARIMKEHSLFLEVGFTPRDAAMDRTAPLAAITEESSQTTQDLRNFKAQGTQGILSCEIKSIIIPLLGDHVLREANHYLRLLKMFEIRGHWQHGGLK